MKLQPTRTLLLNTLLQATVRHGLRASGYLNSLRRSSVVRPSSKTTALRRVVAIALVASVAGAVVYAGPCDSKEHRQFDFWLGEWNVRTSDGKLAGVNKVASEYAGCVLHERYSTSRGYSGESLSTYDAGRKVWHQTWVDSSGTLLLLEGGLRGRSMVLEGQTSGAAGQVVKHRITWTPNADGSVRQHWESTDSKGQWSTAFDGTYFKK